MDAQVKQTVEFLVNECAGYIKSDNFQWDKDTKMVSVWFRHSDAEIDIPRDEFLQAIDEFKSLKTSDDGAFVRTSRRTLRIVAPVSVSAHTIDQSDVNLTMKLGSGVVISFIPVSLWVTIAALKAGAFEADVMPAEAYGSIELFYLLSANKMSEKEEEEAIDTFLFELAASENFVFQKTEFLGSDTWDIDEGETEAPPKFRPLEPFNEGMRLFNAAVPVEDAELRLLSLFKVLEFFAPIVLALDSIESLRKKLDSPLALSPDANYLKSIIDLVRSLDERRNDNQMIRLLFETCLDFVELSTLLPRPHFKELKYGDKKSDIEAQSKAAAEALVATRNQVAHAKSDYRPTGVELPLEELSDFNVFLEAAAVQTIRWYNRLPVHLKLKL